MTKIMDLNFQKLGGNAYRENPKLVTTFLKIKIIKTVRYLKSKSKNNY